MKRLAIDTNIFIALGRGDEKVVQALSEVSEILLPIVVLGELHAGMRGGKRFAENLKRLNAFLAKPRILVPEIGKETAEIYGFVKDSLRQAGNPIPMNDVWIAAQVMEHGAVLWTRDSHFEKIAGLRLFAEIYS